jgi:E3 ubiquitin-protein ligase BRE1
MLQTQLSSSTDLQDTVHRDLMRAQKALDRQRMQHDKAELAWRETRDRDKEAESSGPSKTANGSGHATPNGKVDEVISSHC